MVHRHHANIRNLRKQCQNFEKVFSFNEKDLHLTENLAWTFIIVITGPFWNDCRNHIVFVFYHIRDTEYYTLSKGANRHEIVCFLSKSVQFSDCTFKLFSHYCLEYKVSMNFFVIVESTGKFYVGFKKFKVIVYRTPFSSY